MSEAGAARDWLEARRGDMLAELIGWARIRSVMGPPEYAIDLKRSAHWLAGTLREIGFPTVKVWPTWGGGLPEDRWHDSDESVLVDVLLRGAATLALFWPALADHERG